MEPRKKVYNKGKRPIVFERSRSGVKVIHPGKYEELFHLQAEEVINKFPDAVSESEFKKKPVKKVEMEEEAFKK